MNTVVGFSSWLFIVQQAELSSIMVTLTELHWPYAGIGAISLKAKSCLIKLLWWKILHVLIGVYLCSSAELVSCRYIKVQAGECLFGPCSSVSKLGNRVRSRLLAVKLCIVHVAFYSILPIKSKIEKKVLLKFCPWDMRIPQIKVTVHSKFGSSGHIGQNKIFVDSSNFSAHDTPGTCLGFWAALKGFQLSLAASTQFWAVLRVQLLPAAPRCS